VQLECPRRIIIRERGLTCGLWVCDIDDMSVHVAFCRLHEIWIRKKKSVPETFEEPLVLATGVTLLKQLFHLFL